MDKPMQTQRSATPAFRGMTKSAPATGATCGDEAEMQAACRMEDEGGPPLPEDPRRPRAGSLHFQRTVRRAPLRRVYGVPTVGDVMTRSVRSVRRDTSIKDVAIVMTGDVTSLVPVVDDAERLVGLISERDIVIRACAGDKSIEDMRAADAMNTDPTPVGANQLLRDAVAAMTRLQVQQVPVVDEDFKVVGMISLGDIAKRADSGIDLRTVLAAVSSRKLVWSRAWR